MREALLDGYIYTGTVMHSRRGKHPNAFAYDVYLVAVDIDNIGALERRLKRFGHVSRALVEVRNRDHGPRDGSALRPWIDGVLSRAGIDLDGGTVTLLTIPRVFGFGFYPVSFWYCHHRDGALRAVLAEVQNTIGGHHNYLLHQGGPPIDFSRKPRVDKVFYVSPFIPMDAYYEFRLTPLGETVGVGIHDFVEGPLLFTASLKLHREPLTDSALRRLVMRYGPMSLRAWLLIHYQALRIVAKGNRYIAPPHTPPAEETTS